MKRLVPAVRRWPPYWGLVPQWYTAGYPFHGWCTFRVKEEASISYRSRLNWLYHASRTRRLISDSYRRLRRQDRPYRKTALSVYTSGLRPQWREVRSEVPGRWYTSIFREINLDISYCIDILYTTSSQIWWLIVDGHHMTNDGYILYRWTAQTVTFFIFLINIQGSHRPLSFVRINRTRAIEFL